MDEFIALDCDESDLFAVEVIDAAHKCSDTVERSKATRTPKSWDECLKQRKDLYGTGSYFKEDPFEFVQKPIGDWLSFFETKLAELCGAYYSYRMELRKGNIKDPPLGVDLRSYYEETLANLIAERKGRS